MDSLGFYIDTSVWNYAASPEVGDPHHATLEFFGHAEERSWNLFISELVEVELGRTPEPKKTSMASLIGEHIDLISPIDLEVRELALRYVEKEVVTSNHLNDAIHVAAATLLGCDFLITWNFKHLANIRKEAGFLAVNTESG